MAKFKYLIEKIKKSDFTTHPFKHIYIEEFFSQEDFDEIVNSSEIEAPVAKNDVDLIDSLMSRGFKPISFPGCVTDISKYIAWHKKKTEVTRNGTCEGFGMALRLYNIKTKILTEINDFLASDAFNKAIADKFSIDFSNCHIDGGIQKYLDGYEISPHPDIRKKAATFMVNINPSLQSDTLNHHTHYLSLKPEYRYVEEFWKHNLDIDRAWVPWDWAETVKLQSKNNSIVLFAPSHETLHAVRADYDHLISQRTQLYGNLWYSNSSKMKTMDWTGLDIRSSVSNSHGSLLHSVKNKMPQSLKTSVKKLLKGDQLGKRNV